MAIAKSLNEKGYLQEVYSELRDIKYRLQTLRVELAGTYGGTGKLFAEHERQLHEMEEYIEWKLQVLEKGTPFDWKAAGEIVESTVSVRSPEIVSGPDFSGGYLGG